MSRFTKIILWLIAALAGVFAVAAIAFFAFFAYFLRKPGSGAE